MRFRLIVILLCLAGCSSRDPDVVIRPIPGTEQVAPYDFCITVSPDERWLVFTEWKLPKSRVFDELPPDEYDLRLVSLDMETGERTEHTVESIPPKALGFAPSDVRWKHQVGLEIIEKRFRPAGWRGERFYFRPYRFNGRYETNLVLVPGRPGIQVAEKPEEPGTCSDCFPVSTSRFRGHSWELTPRWGQVSNPVSVAVRDGAIRSVYYVRKPDHGRWDHYRSVYRLRGEGPQETLVELPAKKHVMISIVGVRVSPDERFLAYHVHSKKQAFLSGPREEIYILDLDSREEKRIGRYSSAGNLMWSRDGKRLYFAALDSSDKATVYVVDVAETFGHLEN
jgi:hypothetical protein